jgi:hypothetical protein
MGNITIDNVSFSVLRVSFVFFSVYVRYGTRKHANNKFVFIVPLFYFYGEGHLCYMLHVI